MSRRLNYDLEAELEAVAGELELELEQSQLGESSSALGLREALETAANEIELEAEPFFTRVQPVPHLPGYEEGHEVLTRSAASGLVSGPDLDAILLGVIRPDRGGASYWKFPRAAFHALNPAVQRAHSLRRTRGTSAGAALAAGDRI